MSLNQIQSACRILSEQARIGIEQFYRMATAVASRMPEIQAEFIRNGSTLGRFHPGCARHWKRMSRKRRAALIQSTGTDSL